MGYIGNYDAMLPGVPPEGGVAEGRGDAPGRQGFPLRAALAVLLLALCAGMGIGLYRLHAMSLALDRAVREGDAAAAAGVSMLRAALGQREALNDAVDTEDVFSRNDRLLKFDRLAAEFGAARKRLADIPMTRDEAQILARQQRLEGNVAAHFEEIVELVQEDDLAGARILLHTLAIPAQDRMQAALVQWIDRYQARHGRRMQQIERQRQDAVGTMLGVAAAALLLGLLLAAAYRWSGRPFHPAPRAKKRTRVGRLAAGMMRGVDNSIGSVIANLATLNRHRSVVGAVLAGYRQLESRLTEDDRSTIIALRQKLDLDSVLEESRTLLQASRSGAERARRIVLDLQDASAAAGQRQRMDVNQCLDTALGFLSDRLAAHGSIEREYGHPPPVECNPAELNLVFINLIGRALDAVQEKGSIILRSGMGSGHVWVEIEDTGEGIPAEALPHVFDPVYSARAAGQKGDSGLFTACMIVQQHGGQIAVSSRAGQGSLFRVMLPLQHDEDSPAADKAASGGDA